MEVKDGANPWTGEAIYAPVAGATETRQGESVADHKVYHDPADVVFPCRLLGGPGGEIRRRRRHTASHRRGTAPPPRSLRTSTDV